MEIPSQIILYPHLHDLGSNLPLNGSVLLCGFLSWTEGFSEIIPDQPVREMVLIRTSAMLKIRSISSLSAKKKNVLKGHIGTLDPNRRNQRVGLGHIH
ncbi:MAG: hypothetical protein ACHQYP_07080 [Nitrospiria bacterium]